MLISFNSINSKELLRSKEKRELIFDRSSTFKNSSKIALSVKIDTASIGVVELPSVILLQGGFPKCFKGFDTTDYEILLGKLEHRGIRSLALKWIKTRLHRFPILAIFFL